MKQKLSRYLMISSMAWAMSAPGPAASAADGTPVLPRTRIPYAAAKIRVDGILNERAWRRAARLTLRDNATGRKAAQATTVRLLWTREFLYAAFDCRDTDISASLAGRDDDLWREEAVEIFLDPEGLGRGYLEIEVNPLGALYDAWIEYSPDIDFDRAKKFNLKKISAAAHAAGAGSESETPTLEARPTPEAEALIRDAVPEDGRTRRTSGWTCEIAIPLDELPARLTHRTRLNLTRIDRLNGKHVYDAWSPTFRWFHVPEKFGHAVFAGGAKAEPK